LEKQLELSSPGRSGVGFRGMRERFKQLAGSLEIYSEGKGTTVIAMLPLVNSGPAGRTSEEMAS
jgi:signal transduction histidine kinase